MASYRKRHGKWQVQVRSVEHGSTTKTFHRKTDAKKWAVEQETLMQTNQWFRGNIKELTLGDLIQKYKTEVTPQKRSWASEARRLGRLLKETELMMVKLAEAKPLHFAAYRDERLSAGARTCQYDLVLLRHAWNLASIEWGWPLGENPIAKIRFPRTNPPRERRLKLGEYEVLLRASSKGKSWYLYPMIVLAVETGMRRGEILALDWSNIDWPRSRVLLPITKNGKSRWVPLSPSAVECLRSIELRDTSRIFPISDTAFRHAWDRLKKRVQITDLTFHDLRHEAISRMFDAGHTIPRVMAISGHQTVTQLFRYVQVE